MIAICTRHSPSQLRRLGPFLLMLICLICVSCGATITTAQAPGSMDVSIQIQDYGSGTTPIGVHFATPGSDTIEFVSGETVACNGVFLKYDSNPIEHLLAYGSYVGQVPHQPQGGSYPIAYTPAHATAITIPASVVNAPVHVKQPVNNASVPIPTNAPLTIQYIPSQLANTTILAVASDNRSTYTATLPTSETGTLTVPASNFKNFQPGPGTLGLVRITTTHPAGTPFQQVKIDYQNITQLQVVWTTGAAS